MQIAETVVTFTLCARLYHNDMLSNLRNHRCT